MGLLANFPEAKQERGQLQGPEQDMRWEVLGALQEKVYQGVRRQLCEQSVFLVSENTRVQFPAAM